METLTVDDLNRVYIRAQKDDGSGYENIHVGEASDKQFDTWAKSRIRIEGAPGPWSMEERARFCDMLYQAGGLHILKKDVEL